MFERLWVGWRRSRFVGYPIVFIAVAATTWLIGWVEAMSEIDNSSLLYLLVVLGGAILFGAGPAIAAAMAAVGAFDWFFVEPVGSLLPRDPDAGVALLLFLAVGIAASQLAAGLRQRTEEALEREREATALYTLNSLLVSTNDPGGFVAEALRAFKDDLAIEGLSLLVPGPVDDLAVLASAGYVARDTPEERAVAADAFRRGMATSGTPRRGRPPSQSRNDALDPIRSIYTTVQVNERPMAVLQFCRASSARELTPQQRRFLRAISQQFGIALERARLQGEAAEAAVLRRAEEVKTAVLNSVTHDLRTPLAMIKASAGSLRQDDVEWSDEERDNFAGSIEKNVDRLDSIVGNLLDLSRIDAGMIQPERQYHPLAPLVDDVVNRLRPLLVDYNVSVDVPDDLPPVPIDYVAIDRVLSNLIENAAHHTAPGTSVVITARCSGTAIVVSVADTGPGIPAPIVDHIFDRFYRRSASYPDARRGAGLGLAVAKGLVEAHHGRIWVDTHEGQGATFSFSLPLTASDSGADSAILPPLERVT